jgi:hypothetical protein
MSIQVANVTTNTASVYTSSGNTAITFLSLCNYSASNVSANVYVVPNGGSVGDSTAVLASLGITTLDTYQLYSGGEKLLLGNGDSIQVSCTANNSITVTTSYTTI